MEWIKVEDRLPDIDEHVLGRDKDGSIYVIYRIQTGYYIECNCREGSKSYPTHWMPLPEPPKE